MSLQDSFDGFYQGRKVLVTGHTGFKGSWLALWLAELGAKVVGYSLQPPSDPNLFDAVRLADRLFANYAGDLRDLGFLTETVQKEKPEIIFHLAAQTLVQHSYLEPVETYATNVLGTVHLLEAVRQTPRTVRVCQIITSDKCYQNPETGHRCGEMDPLGGSDPYSSSKAAAELVVAAYRKSYFPVEDLPKHGVSISSVRAGNVIGPGDWGKDRLLPDCISALILGKDIPVRNPYAVRPWQYVLDALSGYLLLAQCQATGSPQFADAWNFGPVENARVTVGELVDKIIALWGEGRRVNQANRKASGEPAFAEARLLQLDSTKAQQKLFWKPVYSLDEMLEKTVSGYRQMFAQKTNSSQDLAVRNLLCFTQAAISQGQPWAPEVLK